jgi:hypothetical protein
MPALKRSYWGFIFVSLMCVASTRAETEAGLFNTRAWRADNGQNSAWLWGAEINGPVYGKLSGSASFLQGHFNQGGDIEDNEEYLALLGTDAGPFEFGVGFSYLAFKNELQRGFVWSYPQEEQERNNDIYGPVIYGRYSTPLGSKGVGLYLSGLLMPYDFGDFNDIDYNGRYLEAAAGFDWSIERVRMAAGYRYRYFDDLPGRIINDQTFSRDHIQGVTVEIGFLF